MPTVPLSALSQTDDAGQDVTPEVGDVLDLGKAKARVDSIDGKFATLCLTEVNGKAATEHVAADEPDEDEDENMDSAMGDAGHKAMGKMLQREMRSADRRSSRR